MHTNERLHLLFKRYLENSCTQEELTELLELAQKNGLEKSLSGELKKHWDELNAKKMEDKVDWSANYRNLINIARSTESFGHPSKPKVIQLPFLKIAVAVVLIIAATLMVWQPGSKLKSDDLASINAPLTPKDSTTNRQLINLPDGSRVVLNANSKLEYPAGFDKTREVYLDGEAYFDIAHDPTKPFIVHTGSLSTKVLGTAFNVNAYRSQQFVEVTVTRGKVEVKAKDKLLGVLQKNEQIIFHTPTEKYNRKVVSVEPVVAWRKNALYFDDVTFAEAALVLSNRYDVTIEFLNAKLRNCQFTAAFNNSATLEHALDVICELNNATYRKEEKKIFISGEGCD